jgi:hypothetical protein
MVFSFEVPLMTWTKFVAAGLFCVLTSPAFAAPTIDASDLNGTAESSGHLDADGHWIWTIRLFQSNPPVDLPDPDGPGGIPNPPPGSPLAAELGFQTDRAVESVTINTADFDDANPGNVIFGWEDLTPVGGTGMCNSAMPGNCPVGLEWDGTDDPNNPATGGDAPSNQIFTSFGSIDYGSDVNGKDYATITVARPVTNDSEVDDVTMLTLLGAYGVGGNKGRIAELNQDWDPNDNNPPISVNYDTYAGAVSRRARGGDTNLDGTINFADFGTLQVSFNEPGAFRWPDGDYNGDEQVTSADFDQLETNYQETYTVFTDSNIASAPEPGGASAAPEPSAPANGPSATTATVTYILDLTINNTWRVFADVSDSDNFGIASYSFEFSGQTLTHDNASPRATAPLSGSGNPAGFTLLRSGDDTNPLTTENNQAISASQDTVNFVPNDHLVYGFGQEASSFLLEGIIPGGDIEQPLWTEPILLAQGTYNRLLNPDLTIDLGSNLTFVNVFTEADNPSDNINPSVAQISNANETLIRVPFTVPEPSSIAMFAVAISGVFGLASSRVRRRMG